MPRRRILQRLVLLGLVAGLVGAAVTAWASHRVRSAAEGHLVLRGATVKATTAIVLGCGVNGQEVSGCLEERLETAWELYVSGRVQRLLLSGDHGRVGYDEVNAMKSWLLAHGVNEAHIFLDHAGFDTHDTMVRARQVFQVTDAVIVSQAFHLPRAIYLAQAAGLTVVGVSADPPQGSVCAGSRVREPLASLKAWLDVAFASDPKFLGPVIPITGDPSATFDR